MSIAETRPLRADAVRNRQRLLEVAVRAFTEDGPDAKLDAIAREAGVGIGTLYRHFPTREALIEAAYRNEVQQLADSAHDLVAELPADRALRTWMDRFTDYITTKRGLGDALKVVVDSGASPYEGCRAILTDSVQVLLEACWAQGSLRTDVEAPVVLSSLTGIILTAGELDQRPLAGQLLDLLMDGLRFRS